MPKWDDNINNKNEWTRYNANLSVYDINKIVNNELYLYNRIADGSGTVITLGGVKKAGIIVDSTPIKGNNENLITSGGVAAALENVSGGEKVNVVDNLNSSSTTDALSANQGKILNTSKLEPSNIKAGENINVNVTGNDVTISSTGGSKNEIYPVGSIYLSVNNTSPASFFGGEWEALAEGRTLWTTTTDGQGGTLISAGLPNITGNALTVSGADTTAGGAMSKSGAQGKGPTGTGTGWRQSYIYFNASSSNTIYGNSSTVQPPAIRVYMWKRVS